MASIFTQIIEGKLPCYKLFENEFVISFLTIDPIQLGHSLVVPKIEVNHIIDVEEPYYLEVFKAAKPISRAIFRATGCKRIGSLVQGFEVPHFHYHLVPMYDPSDLSFSKAKRRSDDEMQRIHQAILQELKK